MNLGQLIDAAALRSDDTESPALWSRPEWVEFFNEAETEACIRARLLEDLGSAKYSIITKAGTAVYALPDQTYDVLNVWSDAALTRRLNGWTLNESSLILERAPLEAGRLYLHAVRLPSKKMVGNNDSPEISERHHPGLVHWALRCAYLKQDSDAFDVQRAMQYEARFDAYFGSRPNVAAQRMHRRKSPPVVRYGGV